jgi:hypothetical protein
VTEISEATTSRGILRWCLGFLWAIHACLFAQ